jgi:hypothetical protein
VPLAICILCDTEVHAHPFLKCLWPQNLQMQRTFHWLQLCRLAIASQSARPLEGVTSHCTWGTTVLEEATLGHDARLGALQTACALHSSIPVKNSCLPQEFFSDEAVLCVLCISHPLAAAQGRDSVSLLTFLWWGWPMEACSRR